MSKVKLRLRRWLIAIVVAILSLPVIGLVFRARSMNEKWQSLSDEFVQQVNSLGTTLEPGGIGSINVPASDADELILLPSYCDHDTLSRHFPNRPPAFIDELIVLSRNDRICPALIWLCDDK